MEVPTLTTSSPRPEPPDDLPPLPTGFKLTQGRKPRTGEAKLHVQFRCGYVDERNTYTAGQLRWDDTGHGWDIVAVRRA